VLKTGLEPRLDRDSETMSFTRRATSDVRQLFVRGRRFAAANVASFAAAVVALSMAGVLTVARTVQFAIGDPVVPAAEVEQHSIATAPAAPSVSPATAKKTPAERDAAPAPARRPAAAAQTASLHVVHLHRLGECRGRLQVTRDGVAFASDEKDDAFTLPFAEFLHAVSDDTLTLRSAAKTYRFKVAGARGGNATTLRAFADRISQARR
jgi:hypothetical protein